MSIVLTCPQGHQWQAAAGDATLEAELPCPLCGTLVEVAPAASAPPTAASAAPPFPEVAGYEIVRELGRGGMGVVFLARQQQLGRLVALKMISGSGHTGPDGLARFHAEAEAIARLQHPNLVVIHEFGIHHELPYFSLEYVEGGALDRRLERKPMEARQAARLVETLAQAMHYAHQRGIIHRDLKPANVLLTTDGTPKISDFGLAKRIDAVAQTRSGMIMGTPCYMAPEQAAGRQADIAAHTDVYALGAILYECLTGRPPFLAADAFDVMQQVLRQEPLPPGKLQAIPRDLETICLKCLEKEPRRRYASAQELADDLARFRKGEPIRARPIGTLGRLFKWTRRQPAAATALAVGLLALLVLIGSGLAYNFRLQNLVRENRERTVQLCVAAGDRQLEQGNSFAALVWWTEALKLGSDEPRQREIGRLRCHSALANCPKLIQILFHDGDVFQVSFSPDGALLASACGDGHARLWHIATGELAAPAMEHGDAVLEAWFSPDGTRLLTSCADGAARLWNVADGTPATTPLRHAASLRCVRFSLDGARIVSAGGDPCLRIWETASGKLLQTIRHDDELLWGAFSPDGTKVAGAGRDGAARVWDATTGMALTPPLRHQGPINMLDFNPEGSLLATASDDGTVRLWALDGTPGAVLKHRAPVFWVAFSPDRKHLLSAGSNQLAMLWDVHTAMVTAPLRHDSSVRRAGAFAPDGHLVATASDDNSGRVWNVNTGMLHTTLLLHHGTVQGAAFSPDGKLVATSSTDNTVRLWGLETFGLLSRSEQQAELPARRPDYKIVDKNHIEIGIGGKLLEIEHPRVLAATVSNDQRFVVTYGGDLARVWDGGGQPVTGWLEHASRVTFADFSPNNKLLVTCSDDTTAIVWDIARGQMAAPPLQHHGTVLHAAFNGDSEIVATGTEDGNGRVWDALTGLAISSPLHHQAAVVRVELHDRVLITYTRDRRKFFWVAPNLELSTEELLELAQVLSGNRLDPLKGYMPLETNALRSLWLKMKAGHPELFTRTKN